MSKIAYESPIVIKEDCMIFPTEIIEVGENDEITKECHSCFNADCGCKKCTRQEFVEAVQRSKNRR